MKVICRKCNKIAISFEDKSENIVTEIHVCKTDGCKNLNCYAIDGEYFDSRYKRR